ncbi:RING finger protein 10 [Sarcoptes scabiei]|uniref:E3 ubiquitin-protein ligase RNF10 n=1 Tax=Sarcoptes scabiei TaxID=52283 RepID=A0A834R9V2_SARSC|nr:RING finger protein 10 [Sarcoptes scabiei]
MDRQSMMQNFFKCLILSLSSEQPGPSNQSNRQNRQSNDERRLPKSASRNVTNRIQNGNYHRTREPKNFSRRFDRLASDHRVTEASSHQLQPKCSRNVHERFVHANCQLVIAEKSNLIGQLENPDLFSEWHAIEEVIYSSKTDDLYCPICLHYPIAARMTRCGHIYCLPCILHYLSLCEEKNRPCPICFAEFKQIDLKSVLIQSKTNYLIGQTITFDLMKIRKLSILPVASNQQEQFKYSFNVRNFDERFDRFHKLFLSTRSHKLDVVKREINELENELNHCDKENQSEICFIESALQQLSQKKLELEIDIVEISILDLLNIEKNDLKTNDYIYFYQCSDGQHIYLHSINIRMLKHQFQELRNCPESISGKIVELHYQKITEECRRRFSHLRHLPISCEFIIAEIEFNDAIVSRQTLDQFSREIKSRSRKRNRKDRVQKMRDENIEIENNRKFYNITPPSNFTIVDEDFPEVLDHSNQELAAEISFQEIQPSVIANIENEGKKQSSYANLLSTSKSFQFDKMVRKKPVSEVVKQKKNSSDNDDEEDEELGNADLINDVKLSDYFESCIRIDSRRKDRKKSKKKQ